MRLRFPPWAVRCWAPPSGAGPPRGETSMIGSVAHPAHHERAVPGSPRPPLRLWSTPRREPFRRWASSRRSPSGPRGRPSPGELARGRRSRAGGAISFYWPRGSGGRCIFPPGATSPEAGVPGPVRHPLPRGTCRDGHHPGTGRYRGLARPAGRGADLESAFPYLPSLAWDCAYGAVSLRFASGADLEVEQFPCQQAIVVGTNRVQRKNPGAGWPRGSRLIPIRRFSGDADP